MRISQKALQNRIDLINKYTDHNVQAVFTQGCGVYLNVDGKEYEHYRPRCNDYEGITNRQAGDILDPIVSEGIASESKRLSRA